MHVLPNFRLVYLFTYAGFMLLTLPKCLFVVCLICMALNDCACIGVSCIYCQNFRLAHLFTYAGFMLLALLKCLFLVCLICMALNDCACIGASYIYCQNFRLAHLFTCIGFLSLWGVYALRVYTNIRFSFVILYTVFPCIYYLRACIYYRISCTYVFKKNKNTKYMFLPYLLFDILLGYTR